MASNTGLERAKQAIRRIEMAGSSMTPPPDFTDFYPILYLQSNPRDLWILKDTRIVSGCIGLLRQYTEDVKDSGKGLLSHSFGFYCFRAMLLGIQVGILAHTDTFDSFVEDFDHLRGAEYVCAALSYFVDRLIVESHDRGDFLRLLGAVDIPSTEERPFLGSVGGLLNTDVDFLLEALWNDRDVFTYLSNDFPTPGWATILWVFGRHMLWALDLRTLQATSDEIYEWGHLRALCFRYSLFATSDENGYLESICSDLRDYQCNSKAECLEFLIDQADAENVINAYISCIAPSDGESIYDMDIASLFVDFIPQDDMLKPAHLMPALIEASLSWIWDQWDQRPNEDQSMNESFTTYCTGIFEAFW
ncbi:hypothetical protein FRC10_009424 [Ceratobasidium sp. 414]|nr:hypothetical protein FRC10_009424 [Ceratobasidium sp. 414]